MGADSLSATDIAFTNLAFCYCTRLRETSSANQISGATPSSIFQRETRSHVDLARIRDVRSATKQPRKRYPIPTQVSIISKERKSEGSIQGNINFSMGEA